MLSRLASRHGEHGNVAPWRSSSLAGGASCIGVTCQAGEDVSGGKDKECRVPICMGDVTSCDAPTHIGIVLHTGNPLLKPGAQLTAVGVHPMVLGTLLGPVLTSD